MKIDPEDIFGGLKAENQNELRARFLELAGMPDFREKITLYNEVAVALMKEKGVSGLSDDPRRLEADARLRNAQDLTNAVVLLFTGLRWSFLSPEVLELVGTTSTAEHRRTMRKETGTEPPEEAASAQEVGLYEVERVLSLALKAGALGQQLLDRKVEPDVLAGRAAKIARRKGKVARDETVGKKWERIQLACEREIRRIMSEGFRPGAVIEGKVVSRTTVAERVAGQVSRNLELNEGVPSPKTVLRLMAKLKL